MRTSILYSILFMNFRIFFKFYFKLSCVYDISIVIAAIEARERERVNNHSSDIAYFFFFFCFFFVLFGDHFILFYLSTVRFIIAAVHSRSNFFLLPMLLLNNSILRLCLYECVVNYAMTSIRIIRWLRYMM